MDEAHPRVAESKLDSRRFGSDGAPDDLDLQADADWPQ